MPSSGKQLIINDVLEDLALIRELFSDVITVLVRSNSFSLFNFRSEFGMKEGNVMERTIH